MEFLNTEAMEEVTKEKNSDTQSNKISKFLLVRKFFLSSNSKNPEKNLQRVDTFH